MTLDELKSFLPASKRHLLDKAYNLGVDEAGLRLLNKPAPAVMSLASLPPLQRNLVFHAVLLHVQHLHAEWYVTDLQKADRMRVSQMKQATANNFVFIRDLLAKSLRIVDTQGELTNAEAAKVLLESYQTLTWEVIESLMSTADPVRFVSMMKLMESGLARIETEDDAAVAA